MNNSLLEELCLLKQDQIDNYFVVRREFGRHKSRVHYSSRCSECNECQLPEILNLCDILLFTFSTGPYDNGE